MKLDSSRFYYFAETLQIKISRLNNVNAVVVGICQRLPDQEKMKKLKNKYLLKSSVAVYLFVIHQNIDCFSWQFPLETRSVGQLDQKLNLVNLIFMQPTWIYEREIMINWKE